MTIHAKMVCSGCGADASPAPAFPFVCPNTLSQPLLDHVLVSQLVPAATSLGEGADENPFIRFRKHLYAYQAALAWGMADADFVALVRRIDDAIVKVDGKGFRQSPLVTSENLGRACGLPAGSSLLVKNETGNVSGSHKARHLMSILLYLEVLAKLGKLPGAPRLAIASCGNAAMAAAVLARAANRPLTVFIPTDADPAVVKRLTALGAELRICERRPGEAGDPCVLRFREMVGQGALPFSCQGPDNGLAVEGGYTLGYEVAQQLAAMGPVDRVFIQVGGGALASAFVQAMNEAVSLGAMKKLPRVHAVQTLGGHPLKRAYDRLLDHLKAKGAPSVDKLHLPEHAAFITAAIRHASTHRAEFMWPWESAPHSVAHGILDDETYDWVGVLEGMLRSGGSPVVVDEDTLKEAHRLGGAETGIDVDPTGSSGLAGLLHLQRGKFLGSAEKHLVFFTGVTRR
jgi:threonine synthase